MMKSIDQELHERKMLGEKRKRKSQINLGVRVFLYAILIIFAIMTVYPLFWLVLSSFKTTQEYNMNQLGFPIRWTFRNYPMAWKIGDFGVLFGNSIFYTTVSAIGIIFFALMASFAFAKIRSKATPFLHGVFIIGILLSVESLMIPIFLTNVAVKLYDTRLGVLIPYIGMGLPIAIYLCTEYIKGIPDSVVESAKIDGAGFFRIFIQIIVPMAKPVVSTVAIMNVLGLWNEFMLINILVRRNSLRSLSVGIMKFSGALTSDYGKQFAALVIGMVPMVIFYLLFRNKITQGVSAGAVKG